MLYEGLIKGMRYLDHTLVSILVVDALDVWLYLIYGIMVSSFVASTDCYPDYDHKLFPDI